MPSFRVVVEMKTSYRRNPNHVWTVNDLHDIDAMANAFPFCDFVLTDRAARNALVGAKLDREMATSIPRTPGDLADALA